MSSADSRSTSTPPADDAVSGDAANGPGVHLAPTLIYIEPPSDVSDVPPPEPEQLIRKKERRISVSLNMVKPSSPSVKVDKSSVSTDADGSDEETLESISMTQHENSSTDTIAVDENGQEIEKNKKN